jgi:protein involved in polysaccharide export with SLBB domain
MISSLAFIQPCRAQDTQGQALDMQPGQALELALSNSNYQVTAGDMYTLTYNEAANDIIVDYSYQIAIPGLGVISGEGKTYSQLRREIETIVTTRFPQSGAQFILTRPSTFTVYIKGEVNSAGERTSSAMGRLSALVNSSLTHYSSTRNITVTSANGQVKAYDLFRAQRFGDLSQDPYLRPGDIITLSKLNRKVSVYGEVKRPGAYELLPGEHIRELIVNYADGFTGRADTGRVELTRYVEDSQDIGDMIYLTPEDINANYPLRDFDAVYVLIKS